jgi:hypothetical protein
MSTKLEKLREINDAIIKRCTDLETYMFIENIQNIPTEKIMAEKEEVATDVK